MRGEDRQQVTMFSYVSPDRRVPQDHPLRVIWALSDAALQRLSGRSSQRYSRVGRPSIAPEKLLRALLLQILYTVRSERLLMEQLDYNLLFRWFVGLNADEPVWDATVFSKNRDRLLDGDIAPAFFAEVLGVADEHRLPSDEHFTVDGTLLEAWGGHTSFKRKDVPPSGPPTDPGNADVDFRGQPRSNTMHESSTDPAARLFEKARGQEAKLAYLGHVLMENRNGLVVDTRVTPATGTAERAAADAMLQERRGTVGAAKAHDTRDLREGGAGGGRHAARGPAPDQSAQWD